MRRNLLVAQALAGSHLQAAILLIAGAHAANGFVLPPAVDCLTLPALEKEVSGEYRSRSLQISLQELIALRAKTIRATLEAFEPDILIVDNVPRGALRELDPTLEYLRAGGRTRCVLGLRDVLDGPEAVRLEWTRAANEDAIRDYYDAVSVYGDPAVYDLVREYQLAPDVAAKVRYVGYLDQRQRLDLDNSEAAETLAHPALPPGRLVLCLVGGGQDGARLAEAFAEAELPPKTNGLILTGPFMPPQVQRRLRQRVALSPRLRLLSFHPEPVPLINCADRVIAMGGYNTICEVLSFEKPALVAPRLRPRTEQLIRVQRLHELGLLEMLHPDRVSPEALSEWLAREMEPPRARRRIDFNGLGRLPRLLEEILASPPRVGHVASWRS